MTRYVRLTVLSVCLLTLVVSGSGLAASFKEHLVQVPGDANVLILINAEKARNSQYAKRLRAENQGAPLLDRSILTSPKIERAVMAAKLDMRTRSPLWELAVISTFNEPDLNKLSGLLGGSVDSLEGLPVLHLSLDADIVRLAPKLSGVVAPADRQAVSRWIRNTRARGMVSVSDYLKEMAVFPDKVGTEIIMAMDLDNVVSRSKVREFLNRSKTLSGKNVDLDRLSQLLTSIRGATLGIRITNRPSGMLRIDFGQDAAIMAPVAKPLILEILANFGATIDEFADWKVNVKGNTVYLGGIFSVNGLRRVLSLAEPPLPPLDDSETSQVKPVTPRLEPKTAPTQGDGPVSPGDVNQVKAQASFEHFKAVSHILDDVGPRRKRGKSASEYGLWLNRYARKVDKLPILNVDGDLLDYSAHVSNSLRNISNQYRGIGVQAGQYSSNKYYRTYAGNYGGYYGYAWERDSRTPKQMATKKGTATAVSSGMASFDELDNATASIRRVLTERYQIEF